MPAKAVVHPLTDLPAGAVPRKVSVEPSSGGRRPALRVELTDDITFNGQPRVDYIDQPTFVLIPTQFTNGTITVDLLSRLNGKGPADARAFAGLAYRINDDTDHFECVYLRPLNGSKTNPPPPRNQRAVQYFAYPNWPFDRLREEYPDGRYEAGASVGPDEWMNLMVTVDGTAVTATVNGIPVLNVAETRAPVSTGAVGLFVDIGTEAYFANLQVEHAD